MSGQLICSLVRDRLRPQMKFAVGTGAPIYKVDTGLVLLIGQLLAHEKQAAEELGQWTEKRDVSGDAATALIIKNLNLGRQRVVEEKARALARGEIWCE